MDNLVSRVFGHGSVYETFNAPPVLSSGDLEQNIERPSDTNDNEVPESIMFEGGGPDATKGGGGGGDIDPVLSQTAFKRAPATALISPREKALWKWANIENLDIFLQDVYDYFLGNGIECIMLSRAINLITFAFVVGFANFLGNCVNYKAISDSSSLDDIIIPQCMSKTSNLNAFAIWTCSLLWFLKALQYILDIQRLVDLKNFYTHLLDIPSEDMQTISWQEIVHRVMALRDDNPVTSTVTKRRPAANISKQRIDAHDIANRIMRKENYMIALFNKEILDLTLPIPFLGSDRSQYLTRGLEWNLSLCIIDFVFNEEGQVRPIFLKDSYRKVLAESLRRRFIFAGIMNIICAPFLLAYLALLSFFRYFNEYHRNPSYIGMRSYTPLAEWKFREFNELFHLFQRRIYLSNAPASDYVNQFPKEKTNQVLRLITFISGSFAAVLTLASLFGPERFLGFEVIYDRTVIFFIGLFGTVAAVSRGMIPEETLVSDPEASMKYLSEFTHFMPARWNGKLHSEEVRREFCTLYDLKIKIVLQEIAGALFAPLILCFSLPKCSERIVDFFREFTVHVDGIGYVCSFAVFEFASNEKRRFEDLSGLRGDYYSSNDGKMLKSYMHFMNSYTLPGAANGLSPSVSMAHQAYLSGKTPGSPLASRSHYLGNNNANKYAKGKMSQMKEHHSPVLGFSTARHSNRQQGGVFGGAASPLSSTILLDPHHLPMTGIPLTGMPSGSASAMYGSHVGPSTVGNSSGGGGGAAPYQRGIRHNNINNNQGATNDQSPVAEEDESSFNPDNNNNNNNSKDKDNHDGTKGIGNGRSVLFEDQKRYLSTLGDSFGSLEDANPRNGGFGRAGRGVGGNGGNGADGGSSSTVADEESLDHNAKAGVLGLLNEFYNHHDVNKMVRI